MNPLSIQRAVISELELHKDALQPTIEVECEWNGGTIKKHVPDIGNTLLNELVTGKIEEPAVKPALERLLGRTITKAEERSPEAIIRTVVQKCRSEGDSSGIGSPLSNPFAELSTSDDASDSEWSSMSSFIATASCALKNAKNESLSSEISEQDAAEHIESLLPSVQELKKNRLDKRDTREAFTVVKMKPTRDNVDSDVMLLNTLPDVVLDTLDIFGWDPTKTEGLPIRQKQNPISGEAVETLAGAPTDIKTPSKGRYLGSGTYGTVKFALVPLYEDGEKIHRVCVAKKMHLSSLLRKITQKAEAEGKSQDELEADMKVAIANKVKNMRDEIAIQNYAGADISPVIYGYSHTWSKNDQDLLIVFMEPAVGINGERFFRQGVRYTIKEKRQLLLNLLEKAQELQNKSIFHNDYKLNNCSFDPETLNSSIIDFGFATTKEKINFYAPEVSCNYPPEATKPSKKHAAKIDVYQLGVLLTTIMGTDSYTEQNPFFRREPTLLTHWSANQSLAEIQEDIDRKLDLIKLPNESSKELIRDMTAADPGKRITLNEAVERFKEIHWEPDTL